MAAACVPSLPFRGLPPPVLNGACGVSAKGTPLPEGDTATGEPLEEDTTPLTDTGEPLEEDSTGPETRGAGEGADEPPEGPEALDRGR